MSAAVQTSSAPKSAAAAVLRALRPGHWTKNALVFVPLLLAHRWTAAEAWGGALLAFVAMSMAASAGYLLNDLADVEHDRFHPTKRLRPFASGALPLWSGVLLASGLAAASVMIGGAHSARLAILICIYLAATVSYSRLFKREAIVDVGVLAALYMLRLFIGGEAAAVELSGWLLAFAGLFFLSLALAKRHVEIRRRSDQASLQGRGYGSADWPFTLAAGMSAAYGSVIIFCLYLSSATSAGDAYGNARALWPVAAVLLLWLSRVWLIAHRGELSYDPVEFAFRDARSRYFGIVVASLFYFAV